MWRRALTAMLACCALGCEGEVTEIVVVVDTDLSIPEQTDTIRIRVVGPSGDSDTVDTPVGSEERMPVVLGLLPATDRLEPVTIRAVALLDGNPVVASEMETGFVHGEVRMARLLLLDRCRDRTCPEDQTCSAGGCVPREVPAEELPAWNGPADRVDAGSDCVPGAETCNGIDDDCDGTIDEGHDRDGDGFTWCGGGDMERRDCNDSDSASYPAVDGEPGGTERCDGQDNDCDGAVDEDPPDGSLCASGEVCAPHEGGCISRDCTVTGCPEDERCDLALDPPTCTSDGSRCTSTDDCAPGEVCDGDTGLCVVPRPLGEPCVVDAECESGVCVAGEALGLDEGKVCGRPCCNTAGCPADTVCWVPGTGARSCLPPSLVGLSGAGSGAAGDGCSAGDECLSGLCSTEGECVGHCTTDDQCDNACVLGEVELPEGSVAGFVCADPPGSGEPTSSCSADSDCRSGVCVDTSFENYCGQPCGSSAQCAEEAHCFYAEKADAFVPICLISLSGDTDICCSDAHCAGGARCRPVAASGSRWEMRCDDT